MLKNICRKQGTVRVVYGVLAIMLVLMMITSGCSKNTAQGTVDIRLAHFFPATHPAEVELIQPWAQAIAEATEGRVTITSYPGGTLLPADAIYDGVVTKIAEMGLSCFSYTRGRFPVLEAFELPGVTYSNSKVASKVAWDGIQELNSAEVQDTKLMMVFATGPGDLYTKEPVRNLNDLKGLTIRATGLSAKTLQALGASPVAMPQSEAYEALSKGVVKGNLGPIEVLQGWNQAEVTEYITQTPFLYNTLFFITVNKDVWNSITPQDQETILGINERFFSEVAMGLWDKQNESAFSYAVLEKGMEVIELPEEEVELWIELIEPIQNEFISNTEKAGLPGAEALALVNSLADKYNRDLK
ncbi:MAG: TRAP transporter substrate-binding protein [Clostridiales bacterium]|jgi:TRAP-type C4-dicarboxylate transport system substrate-binding protein|nr:TRAP transporter substrate-binding protein [Clostridiales bacterium]